MKVLFGGLAVGNGGPDNVNRGIIKNLTDCFMHAKSDHKYIKRLELLWKCLLCDVLVVSGVSRDACVLVAVAKLLGKKTVYIMHGCAAYETVINNQANADMIVKQEQYLLENADLLLPVSKMFMHWVQDRYPQYAGKTSYLYNGTDTDYLKDVRPGKKVPGSVVATGADREIKNNAVVARAVEAMGGKAELEIYGWIYHGVPEDLQHARYMGCLTHDQYIEKLTQTELFVLNSLLESFSISAIEALVCGCSVLLSANAGVTDLLELEECDIIYDPMNEEELREKISYLLEHPNNSRIMSKLDLSLWSYRKSVERLESLCRELVQK